MKKILANQNPDAVLAKLDEVLAAISRQSGSTANITAPITQGPCSVIQNGGSNNTAAPNCSVPDRRLSAEQMQAIKESALQVCPLSKSIAVTAANANQEAQMYAMDFVKALRSGGCKADLLLPIPGLLPDVIGIHLGVRDLHMISLDAVKLGNVIDGSGLKFNVNPLVADFFPDEQFVWIVGAREDTSPRH